MEWSGTSRRTIRKLSWLSAFDGGPLLEFCQRHLVTRFPNHAEENQTVGGPSPSAMSRARKVSLISLALSGKPSLV